MERSESNFRKSIDLGMWLYFVKVVFIFILSDDCYSILSGLATQNNAKGLFFIHANARFGNKLRGTKSDPIITKTASVFNGLTVTWVCSRVCVKTEYNKIRGSFFTNYINE